MEYSGIAISDQVKNGRTSGRIIITPGGLQFKHDEYPIQFSFKGLRIKNGGANNSLIFFEHPDYPEFTLYTQNKKILKDPFFLQNQQLQQQIKPISSRRIQKRLLYFGGFTTVLGLLFGLVFYSFEAAKGLAQEIPFEYEKQLGDEFLSSALQDRRQIEDAQLDSCVTLMTDQLVQAVEDTSFIFNFYLVEDPAVNAFALPGGHVVINSGLVASADNYEEIAAVIAHEMAHVTRRHHVRNMISMTGLYAAVIFLTGGEGGLWETLLSQGIQLNQLKYSRDMEREADEGGWNYLISANINPQGMITFFEKLNELHGGEEEDALVGPSLFSTHPETMERIETLTSKVNELSEAERNSFDNPIPGFEAFQILLNQSLTEPDTNENNN